MRIALCFRSSGVLHRLIWVNESSTGIFYGFLGAGQDVHLSFHQDGVQHIKMGDEYHGMGQFDPIREWRGVRQLSSTSISVSHQRFSTATAYQGDKSTETVLALDDRLFYGDARCTMDFWLLDRGSEPRLLEMVGRHLVNDLSHRMILEVVTSLDNYPDHKLGITLRALTPSSPPPTA